MSNFESLPGTAGGLPLPIKIIGKGNKERLLNLSPISVRHLRRYICTHRLDSEYLFPNMDGRPLTRAAIHKIVKKAGEVAGIAGAAPHRIRKTFATEYAANGGDTFSLQHEMGHSDIRTTMRYVSVQQEEVHRKHQQYSPATKLIVSRGSRKSHSRQTTAL